MLVSGINNWFFNSHWVLVFQVLDFDTTNIGCYGRAAGSNKKHFAVVVFL